MLSPPILVDGPLGTFLELRNPLLYSARVDTWHVALETFHYEFPFHQRKAEEKTDPYQDKPWYVELF